MYSWQVNMFHSLQGEDLERFPRNEDVLSSSGFYMHKGMHHHRRKREMCKALYMHLWYWLPQLSSQLTDSNVLIQFTTYPFNEFNVSLVNSTNTGHLLWAPHCTRDWPCKDDLDVDLPVSRLQWGKRHKPDFSVDYFSSPCDLLPASSFFKTPSF